MEFLVLLGLFLLVVIPILAASGYARSRRTERLLKELSEGSRVVQRVYALERRLAALESRLGVAAPPPGTPVAAPALRPQAPPTPEPVEGATPPAQALPPAVPPAPAPQRPAAPGPPPPPPRAATAPPAVPSLTSPPPKSPGIDWETVIAGRWLNRVGIAALLLASALFGKWAFDNNWVGPIGRVTILLLAGAALLVFSQWLLRRDYLYFSEGIAGLGGGVLYVALFTGWSAYELFPQGVAFAGMMVVTAAMLAIAVGRDSQRIAVIGLLGGFLTPWLVSTGRDQQVILFSYLAVLDAGLLGLAWVRRWRLLEIGAFTVTVIYFVGWYSRFYDPSKLLRTALFATLFFLLFAALPLVRGRRAGRPDPEQVGLVLANAFFYLLALRAMLWPDYRWTLTLAVLALAALHLLALRFTPAGTPESPSLLRLLYAGMALTFATLAIPIRLEGRWITIAWAVQGAVLVWSGFRASRSAGRLLRAAGLLLFVVVLFRLLVFPIPASERFLLNARFGAFLVAAACFGIAAYLGRRYESERSDEEAGLFAAVALAANLMLLWSLTREVWEGLGRAQDPLGLAARQAQPVGLAVLWGLYGLTLLWIGFLRGRAGLRWQGLPLLALAALVLLFSPVPVHSFLFNPRFGAFLIVTACAAGAALLARREGATESLEKRAYTGLALFANFLLLYALSREVWEAVGRMQEPMGLTARQLQPLALVVLWTLYGLALVVLGERGNRAALRWQGLVLFVLAAVVLLANPVPSHQLLFNPRFGAFLVLIACAGATVMYGRRRPERTEQERQAHTAAAMAANFLLLYALSREVWDGFGRMHETLGLDARLAQQMGLSLLWAVYATAMIVIGVRRAAPLVRWQALALFGVVVAKVFLFDLSFLEKGYRVLSFMVLGVVLMVVSFLYTRRLAQERAKQREEESG